MLNNFLKSNARPYLFKICRSNVLKKKFALIVVISSKLKEIRSLQQIWHEINTNWTQIFKIDDQK